MCNPQVEMSGVSELRECDEASVPVEGDAEVLLEEDEEEDEDEEDKTESNKELLERLRELEVKLHTLQYINTHTRQSLIYY